MAKTAAPRVSRPRAVSLRNAPSTAPQPPLVSIDEQRIYHITHIRNLPDILSSGCLLADASDVWETRPTVDISSTDNREVRRSTEIEARLTVAQYVPFFLTPNPTLWEAIRARVADPRLSPDVRHTMPTDFVILVSTVAKAGDVEAVVADGDATDARTRFGTNPELGERMLRRLHADSIIAAEFLVEATFPFELITLVGVANDKARDKVKAILQSSKYSPKVAVYPPWFARPSPVK